MSRLSSVSPILVFVLCVGVRAQETEKQWLGVDLDKRPVPTTSAEAQRVISVVEAVQKERDVPRDKWADLDKELDRTKTLLEALRTELAKIEEVEPTNATIRRETGALKNDAAPTFEPVGPITTDAAFRSLEAESKKLASDIDALEASLKSTTASLAAKRGLVDGVQARLTAAQAAATAATAARTAAEQALSEAQDDARPVRLEAALNARIDEALKRARVRWITSHESERLALEISRLEEQERRDKAHKTALEERLTDLTAKTEAWTARKTAAAKADLAALEQQLANAPEAERPLLRMRIVRARLEAEASRATAERSTWRLMIDNTASEYGAHKSDAKTLAARITLAQESGDLREVAASTRELRRLAELAKVRADHASSLIAELRRAERTVRRNREDLRERKSAVADELARERKEAQALAGERWERERLGAIWDDLARELDEVASAALKAEQDLLSYVATSSVEVSAHDEVVKANLKWLQFELLWSREESAISLDSTRQAIEDVDTIAMDAWRSAGGALGELRDHVIDPASRMRAILGGAGVLVLFVGLLVFARRRDEDEEVPTKSPPEPPAEARPAGEKATAAQLMEPTATEPKPLRRALRVLSHDLAETKYSLLFAVALVGFPLAVGMPWTDWGWLAALLVLPFGYRFFGVMLKLVFEPESAKFRRVPLDDNIARTLFRAGRYVLRVSAIFLAIYAILMLARYDETNPGFVELVSLLFKFSVYLVLVVTLFRPSVVRGLIRGDGLLARSAKTAVITIYPLIVLAVCFVVVLDALRYDVAASEFRIALVKTAAIGIGAYFVYRKLLWMSTGGRDVDRRVVSDDFDDNDEFLEAGRARFVDRTIRLALRIVFIPVLIITVRLWPEFGVDVMAMGLTSTEGGLTLGSLVWATVAIAATFVGVRFYKQLMTFIVMPSTKIDKGLRYTIIALTSYVLIAIGIIVTLSFLKVKGDQIAMVTGALAFGIGFGLQTIVKNLFSGLILLVERPVKVGDRIVIDQASGVVEKITMRATTVMTWDGNGLVIPNEQMIGGVLNNQSLGNPRLRTKMMIGVAYGSDVDKVRDTLLAAVKRHGLVLKRPAPQVLFVGFGASSLDFQLLFWTKLTTSRPQVESDLRYAIEADLGRENIEIPFPQTDLHIRSIDEEAARRLTGRRVESREEEQQAGA